MDREYIDAHRIVERYLSGDLLVREARAFEKYCLEHPELLAELPIPVRLKARLAKRPLDETDTGSFSAIPSSTTRAAADIADGTEEEEPPFIDRLNREERRKWLAVAGVLVLAGGAALAYHFARVSSLEREIVDLGTAAATTQLRPPSSVQSHRLVPGRQGPQSAPGLDIGWPDPPQLLELRIDVSQLRFNAFSLTIEKTGEARVMQIRRMTPDSNRELRIALNSSAFGPGDYRLDLQGYTWRGELVDAGWLRLGLQ